MAEGAYSHTLQILKKSSEEINKTGLKTMGQRMFWVKAHIDPSVLHAWAPNVLQFWLELDPATTIGTAMEKFKSDFGIFQEVVLFLEGHALPPWMSTAIMIHAKEPVVVQPLKLGENQMISFGDLTVNGAQQVFNMNPTPGINNNELIGGSAHAAGTNCGSFPANFILVKSCGQPKSEQRSPSNTAVVPELLHVKADVNNNNNNNNEVAETSEKPRGKRTYNRRKPLASKTTDGNSFMSPEASEKGAAAPRRSRRISKARAEPNGEEQTSSKSTPAKTEDAVGGSPELARKRGRSGDVADSVPLMPPLKKISSFPSREVNCGSESLTAEFDDTSPVKADTKISNEEILDGNGILPPSFPEQMMDEENPQTVLVEISNGEEADIKIPKLRLESRNPSKTEQKPSVGMPSLDDPLSVEIFPGCWITFPEKVESPIENSDSFMMNGVYYVTAVDGSTMTLSYPEYDVGQENLEQWKQKQVDLRQLSHVEVVEEQRARQMIYDNWPLGALLNAIQL